VSIALMINSPKDQPQVSGKRLNSLGTSWN
jgi:hypothetical protein